MHRKCVCVCVAGGGGVEYRYATCAPLLTNESDGIENGDEVEAWIRKHDPSTTGHYDHWTSDHRPQQ